MAISLTRAAAEKSLIGNIPRVDPRGRPNFPGMFLRPVKCRGLPRVIFMLALFRQICELYKGLYPTRKQFKLNQREKMSIETNLALFP